MSERVSTPTSVTSSNTLRHDTWQTYKNNKGQHSVHYDEREMFFARHMQLLEFTKQVSPTEF